MLPALPEIGRALSVKHPNDAQLVISSMVLGMGIGQILSGPLSDCFGRKPIIFYGFVIFALGCLLSIFSTRFDVMMTARILQGIGVSGPRTAIVALIRDRFGGRSMAQIMSTIMAVFILVPAIAPALGQAIVLTTNWRAIFWVLMIQSVFALTWFSVRQPETLPRKRRVAFSLRSIISGAVEVCTNRTAFGYTLASGLILGGFLGYLNSAQQIFQEVYSLGHQFPIYMAVPALAMGSASYLNSRIVMRVGMRALSHWAVRFLVVLMTLYLAATFQMGGHSPLWLLMITLASAFFCLGMVFGNLNAIAMEPLSHIAGIGAAVIGFLSIAVSVPLAVIIGRCYNGTTLPMIWGFVILGALAALAMFWGDTARGKVAG
jgi:DHA1 family bicyclomycin/chloramphenicol resistance-like MFS transporter